MAAFTVQIQIQAPNRRGANVNYTRTVSADAVLDVAEAVDVALDGVDQGPTPPEVPA